MPYIPKARREILDDMLDLPNTVGELNYRLSSILLRYWKLKGESYATYNDILGALEGAKLEMYRTLIGPYEQSKLLMNGPLLGQPDVAWAAGFFDGEGCTNYHVQLKRDGTPRPKGNVTITVPQKEPLLLQRFREAVGGVGYVYQRKAYEYNEHPVWTLQIQRADDVLHTIMVLWPFLGFHKRIQALDALRKFEAERDIDLGLPNGSQDDWPDVEAKWVGTS